MLDISKAFTTQGEPISDFFQRPGVGFYIPLYQRDYSWDGENIDQLMEDICRGVEMLANDDDAIRFLGTIILVKENNPNQNIQPKDIRALPTSIENIIDGQQRLSTIALLACLLYKKFYSLEHKLPSNGKYDGLIEAIKMQKDTLEEIFSVDLKRGHPNRKPIIIRGSIDCWTFSGREEEHYLSDVSSCLAFFIKECAGKHNFSAMPNGTSLVARNLKLMDSWLGKIERAHLGENEETFPPANIIIKRIPEAYIWSYPRPDLVAIIQKIDFKNISKEESVLCSLVQLFAFTHFLLYRCCFTTIEPISDNWAFDMFQSLNASGTPLTAIETFKPIVVNTLNATSTKYKESSVEEYFGFIDKLLGGQSSAAAKSRLTNEFLTSFALIRDGAKLSSQFSEQRRWLQSHYAEKPRLEDKNEFIFQMGYHAKFYTSVLEHKTSLGPIKGLEDMDKQERDLAELAVRYLKDAGHKMANTILSRFYTNVLRDELKADEEFASSAKAVAAFYTLWRAIDSNAGLDNIYRVLLKGDIANGIYPFAWHGDKSCVTSSALKKYFRDVLSRDKVINSKAEWLKKAVVALRYDKAKPVCRFALFVSAHDTISDSAHHGLMKIGTPGVYPYLEPDKWISDDFDQIEHVAPSNPREDSMWDKTIYQDELVHSIGNLTLLPEEINISVSNKGWIEKLLYYQHLAETDPDKINILSQNAQRENIVLNKSTISMLKEAKHNHHIMPIVELGTTGDWNAELVQKRAERICSILWDRITPWLDI